MESRWQLDITADSGILKQSIKPLLTVIFSLNKTSCNICFHCVTESDLNSSHRIFITANVTIHLNIRNILFSHFSMIRSITLNAPCNMPHNIKVQFAPCQIPLIPKTIIVFKYVKIFPLLFPSYSVKPKSIDFTGFDDFYFTSNKSRE